MERTDFCTSVPPHIHPPMAQVPCATTEAVIPDCPRGLYIMLAGSAIPGPAGTDFCTSVPPHIHPPMAQVPCATTEAVIPDCPRGLYIMLAGSAIHGPSGDR